MGVLKVISPGILTTIQDLGRFGYQQFGMPVGGAMDEYALRTANILVGNDEGEACFEITLVGPTLEFTADSVIAITGADLGATLNGKEIPLEQTVFISKGGIVKFTGVKSGCRAYLSIAGGLDIPSIMGSKSTYIRGKIGGFQGRSLRAGDEIRIFMPSEEALGLVDSQAMQDQPSFNDFKLLRVILGPQAHSFTNAGLQTFLNNEFKITNEADRMGYRLSGPKIEHKEMADIISDSIALGSIQIPGHGLPIIMMADRQTTGGYTKIATIITPDLSKIAQAKPGDAVCFQAVSIEEAHEIYRQFEEKINMLKSKLRNKANIIQQRALKLTINGKKYVVDVQEIS